jgi:hypothetical protein
VAVASPLVEHVRVTGPLVTRRDVIAHAFARYIAGRITLSELLGTVRQWRHR